MLLENSKWRWVRNTQLSILIAAMSLVMNTRSTFAAAR